LISNIFEEIPIIYQTQFSPFQTSTDTMNSSDLIQEIDTNIYCKLLGNAKIFLLAKSKCNFI